LWQGASIVEANTIDFDRDRRSMIAKAAPTTANGRRKLVNTVLPRQDKGGKQAPIQVTSQLLTYADLERVAQFDGGVVVRGADGVTTANHADVYLRAREDAQPDQKPQAGNLQSSQLDHIVATGDVHMQQPTRQGWGDKLVYQADQEQFVLTGKAPHIFDAERGNIWGDSLTFYSRSDRVVVEGSTTHRTVTETRVSK
jgi:lipopolysaccharide export system protein LptA